MLVSNSRRYSLDYQREDVFTMLFFANLLGHFLARESAKSTFPNIPARRPYSEKKNSKTFAGRSRTRVDLWEKE